MSDIKTYEELSAERKALQKQGLVPEWYTTAAWQMFNSKYSSAGEAGVRGRMKSIARTLSLFMPSDKAGWEDKFFNLMWRGWLSPASPVLGNTGNDKGLPISCSGGFLEDSIDGFYTSLHEQAILSKYGFGCSGYFGEIRPRGTRFGVDGLASGVVPVIEDFATMASKVSQGGVRKGSTASYLPIDHGDFHELCDLLASRPDGLNIGWNVSDSFIAKLRIGDVDANERFTKALHTKLTTGKGYFFFPDKANRHRPQMYKDLGLDIKASNLC